MESLHSRSTSELIEQIETLHSRVDELEKTNSDLSEELEKSRLIEIKFRLAMEATTEGLWDWDVQTGEVYYSSSWGKILGEETIEPAYKSWESRLHPDDKEEALQSLLNHLENKSEHWSFEHRLRTSSNEWKWVLGKGRVILNDIDGKPLRMIGTMADISERKKAENELKERTNFIQTILNKLPIGLAVNNIDDGKVSYMNNMFETIYGWPKVKLTDVDSFFSNVYPDPQYREKIRNQVLSDIQSGDPDKMRWDGITVTGEDGTKKIVSAMNIPMFDQNMMISLVQDITKQKETEEALRESEEKYKTIFENSGEAILLTTPDGGILSVNDSACRLFGRSEEEICNIGREMLVDTSDPRLSVLINERLRTGRTSGRLRLVRKDGSKFEGELSSVVFTDTNGNDRTSMTIRDLTKQIEDEEKIRRYESIVSCSTDLMALVDENFNYLAVNESYGNAFNKVKDDIVGHNVVEVVGEEIFQKIIKPNAERCLKGEKVNWQEWIHFPADTKMYMDINYYPYFDEDNNAAGFVVNARNITSKKQAEEELIESENRYRKLVELSPDAVMVHQNGKFVFVNNAAVKIFNANSKDDFIGEPIIDRVHPDFQNIVKSRVDNLVGQQLLNVPKIEEKFIKFDGAIFDVEVTASQFLYEGKDAVQVIAHDITERKQRENELKKRTNFIQTVLDKLPIGLAVNNIDDGRVSYMNNMFEAIYGWPREELGDVDSFFSNVYPDPKYREEIREQVFSGIQSGDPEKMKWDGITVTGRSGNEKIISAMNIPMFDQNQMISLVQDITKQKEYEMMLVKERNQAQQYLDVAGVMLGVLDDNGGIIKMNNKGCEILGYKEEEIIGKNWFRLCIEEDKGEEIWEVFQGIIDEKLEFFEYYENEIITKSGELKTIAFHNSIIRNEAGKITGILFSGDDITEQKRMHDVLREREDFLSTVVENIPDMIFVKDPSEFRYIRLNKAGEELMAYSRDEILGKNDYDLLPMEQADSTFQQDKDVIARGELADIQEEEVLTRDNKMRKLHTKKIPIYDKDGNPRFLLGISEDITERKLAEQALRESEEKFRTIFNESPIGVELYNAEGMQVAANKASLDMFGIADVSEIQAFNLFDGISLDDQKKEKLQSGESIHYQSRFDFEKVKELQLYKTDGIGKAYLDYIITPLLNSDNQSIQGYLLQVQDITERKQMEEALQASELKFRQIFEESPIAIEYFNHDGSFSDCNKAALNLFGIADKSDLLEYNVFASPQVYKEVKQHFRENKPIHYEKWVDFIKIKEDNIYRTSREDKIYVNISSIPIITGSENETTGFLVQIQDLTARKIAEIALRTSERKLNTLVNNLPGMAYRCLNDEFYSMKFLSMGCEELTGYHPEELVDNKKIRFSDLIHPDDREYIAAEVSSAVNDGQPFELNYRIITKSGEVKWVWERGQSLEDEQENETFLEGIIEDITEKKKAEEALIESEARWRSLTENSADYIMLIDTDIKIRFINHDRTDLKREDLIGKSAYNFIPHPFQNAAKHCFNKVLSSGEPGFFETEYHVADGKIEYFSISVGPVLRSGKVIAMVCSATDITKRKVIENSLKNSYMRLRNLAERLQVVREEERASVAREIHDDLGQSLTAIKMDVSWLQKNKNIDDEMWAQKFNMLLNLINSTIQSVKKIASELRPGILDDLGLIPAIEWQTEEFEKRYKIKCNLNINKKDVTLENKISVAVFRIYQETLTNIARHSKATRVDIHLDFQENRKLFIEIHDNGIGINNETAKSQKSFGILGMRERVSLLKGGMEIIGKPNMGTMVRVVIPY